MPKEHEGVQDKRLSCECDAHWDLAGKPVFEDQVMHVKVKCTRCERVFWVVYEFGYVVFNPDGYVLDLER